MSKVLTKQQLISMNHEKYEELLKVISIMSKEEKVANFPFEDRDKNLRDVLIHLHEWHNMFFDWYDVGVKKDQIPDLPKKGYKWSNLSDLNKQIWIEYQDTTLEEAVELLSESHKKMVNIIETHTDIEIFERDYYAWTKPSNLASYLKANTYSHYNWATKKLKKYLRMNRGVSRISLK